MKNEQLKVAAVVHAYHVDVLPFLLERLRNAGPFRNVFVTVCPERRAEVEALCQAQLPDAKIRSVVNAGYDLGPFLAILPELIEGSFDVALKIHTKKGAAGLEETRPDAGNIWSDLLLDAVLRSPSARRSILEAFATNPLLALAGPAELYKSAKFLAYGNEPFMARTLGVLDPQIDPAQDWGFFAGSMFWFRPEIFRRLLGLSEEVFTAATFTPTGGQFASPRHALERVLGRMPGVQGQQTALIYCHPGSEAVHLEAAATSRIPHGSRYPVGVTLAGALDFSASYSLLHNSPEFDVAFYQRHYPDFARTGGDATWHYLRYGVYEGCNPNQDFDSTWYWDENLDVLERGLNPLVHYIREGKLEGRSVFTAAENVLGCMEQTAKAGLFDPEYYLRSNPPPCVDENCVLEHFCTQGWKELRAPCSGKRFDPVWYESEYLTNWRKPINPLLHFASCLPHRELLPRPCAPQGIRSGHKPKKSSLRRACLFAAYDPDNIIDETVLRYVRELAYHCDVFFLADCSIPPRELNKLTGYTAGTWAFSHGEYDFGSYKRLAINCVGEQRLSEYDEVLLVNDSAYLLRPLDEVFSKMDRQACAWWGLQATKGVFATRNVEANRFPGKIAFAEVVRDLLPGFERQALYDFFMGSYFLAFRQPAYEELYRVLGSVRRERFKKNVIYKYEVNLSRRLILAGHPPGSFMDHLYPLHPVYTENHFDMIAEGFPLLKRVLFTENHYRVPDLWRWSEILNDLLPDLNLSPIKRNLERVCDPDRLRANLNISPNERFFVPANLSEIRYATAAASAVGEKCLSP